MDKFWEAFLQWDHFGQAIFILIILAGAAGLLRALAYYVAVMIRGWPVQDIDDLEIEEDISGCEE